MTEQVEVIKAKCNWSIFFFIFLILTGIILLALYAATGEDDGEEVINIEEHSSIVEDKLGDAPYLTLSVKCYYCDVEKYGVQWNKLIRRSSCKNGLFAHCFTNFTSVQQTTKVVNLVNTCKKNCICTDPDGWCTPNDVSCDVDVRCCHGDVICPIE